MILRFINKVTVGLIHESRVFEKEGLVEVSNAPDAKLGFKTRLTQNIIDNVATIPTGREAEDLQLWCMAMIQQVDKALASNGYWAELPYLLDILEDTKLFVIDKDISRVELD